VRAIGIIPARHASTRFPGKPLALICGRPMIQWVHERVTMARSLSDVLVATDDERIRACVQGFGGKAVLTASRHESGTDRLAEVAAGLDVDVVVNVQGDEPLIAPDAVDAVTQALADDASADMATLAGPLTAPNAYRDPSVVKVVTDASGRALYFSRAPIPWDRAASDTSAPPTLARRHVGVYAYRRAFLLEFQQWPVSELERCEGLEQLRALEHGARIRVCHTEHEPLSVDTPSDVAAVEQRLRALHGNRSPRDGGGAERSAQAGGPVGPGHGRT
jgi:3-deoxy-manno-octulosonate cytidylyltransferase (CMP-KDO synthetase)